MSKITHKIKLNEEILFLGIEKKGRGVYEQYAVATDVGFNQ